MNLLQHRPAWNPIRKSVSKTCSFQYNININIHQHTLLFGCVLGYTTVFFRNTNFQAPLFKHAPRNAGKRGATANIGRSFTLLFSPGCLTRAPDTRTYEIWLDMDRYGVMQGPRLGWFILYIYIYIYYMFIDKIVSKIKHKPLYQ